MKKFVVPGLILITLVVASVAIGAEKQSLQIDGSTTVGPIGTAFAEYFMKTYPDIQITVKATGSGDGAAALIDGRCDIAMMSRFMKPDAEFKKAVEKGVYPVAHTIALDAVCVVVHPSNPVKELTTEQVRDIYTGKIKNWKDIGGPDLDIVAITRDTSSGTYEVFHELVMKKQDMAGGIETVNSNPQAQARVKTTKGAIGYVGLGFVDEVKTLKIDNVLPTKQTIVNGTYPIARPLYLFTNGYPKLGSPAYKFCTFYLTETGQKIIEEKKFVPLTNY
jgi:phosphate transport system substrate-binding protein